MQQLRHLHLVSHLFHGRVGSYDSHAERRSAMSGRERSATTTAQDQRLWLRRERRVTGGAVCAGSADTPRQTEQQGRQGLWSRLSMHVAEPPVVEAVRVADFE